LTQLVDLNNEASGCRCAPKTRSNIWGSRADAIGINERPWLIAGAHRRAWLRRSAGAKGDSFDPARKGISAREIGAGIQLGRTPPTPSSYLGVGGGRARHGCLYRPAPLMML